MKSEKMFLKNRRGQNIVGILTKPAERESLIIGTAVLQHGYGSTKESTSICALQNAFLENDFQVFNFDSPNSFGESDGKYEDARLGLHADDFEDVTNWVREQKWFTGKLLVSGHSMGGFAATRYTLQHPKEVNFTVAFAPVVSGEFWLESIKKFQPNRIKSWIDLGYYSRESQSVAGRIMVSPYDVIQEAQKHSLFNEGKNANQIFLIACENDDSIPPNYIKKFYDSLTENKEMHILRNASHSPHEPVILKKLENLVSAWLHSKL